MAPSHERIHALTSRFWLFLNAMGLSKLRGFALFPFVCGFTLGACSGKVHLPTNGSGGAAGASVEADAGHTAVDQGGATAQAGSPGVVSAGSGELCSADEDCSGGYCVTYFATGFRACSDAREGSACNHDEQCAGQRCIHPPDSEIAGTCSSGNVGAFCYDDDDCQGAAHCTQNSHCSSGNLGEPCGSSSDCKSQHRPEQRDRVCTAGAANDLCGVAADCESGYCFNGWKDGAPATYCTTGEAGEPCTSNAGCKNDSCAYDVPGNATDTCTHEPRTTGEPCSSDTDCENQICGRNSLRRVCTNGKVGDPCNAPVECASGFCAPSAMPFLRCSNGAPDDRCATGADCASQICVPVPGQDFSVCGA